MKQVYRALWNHCIGVHRKHYFVCEDHELQPQQTLARELESIGEPMPEEVFIERLGLPYEEVPGLREKVCYRLAYQRLYRSVPVSHSIVTFYAHNEKEARSIADWIGKNIKHPYQEESFTRYLTQLVF